MKKQNFTLPEWAWLDANDQNGNALEGRDVLLHVRTHTMLEFLNTDDLDIKLNPKVKQKNFTYKNSYGVVENYVVVVHYSLTEFTNLEDVTENAIVYFKAWMAWADDSIEKESISKIN